MLTSARNGVGGAAVIHGEPGIGKTELLNSLVSDAAGFTVVRGDGYEAEAAIAYAALQRIGLQLRDHLPALSPRHRQALQVACGADEGPAPDRFLVGMAVLSLVAEAGSRQPLLCVVDDGHWLDSESLAVLTFVGRRVQAESTALVLASRLSDDDAAFAGIERIHLAGLDKPSAVALLRRSAPEIVDPVVATRIVDATGGNPSPLSIWRANSTCAGTQTRLLWT